MTTSKYTEKLGHNTMGIKLKEPVGVPPPIQASSTEIEVELKNIVLTDPLERYHIFGISRP